MDRVIEKPSLSLARLLPWVIGALAVLLMVYTIIQRSGNSRLSVDSDRISISAVTQGEFREYYPFDGTVVPETSVFLDLEEGGQVEEIYQEGGLWVEKGTPILRLSNTDLQRTTISTETQLLENLDLIANSQFKRAQDSLMLKDQLLDLDYGIQELEKKFNRYEKLINSDSNPLTQEEYEAVRDELHYRLGKRNLLKERIRQEELLSERQLTQAQDSVQRLNKSLKLLSSLVESLDVKAPISGHLSNIDAQLGQTIVRGTRIGQVDLLDKFKIRLNVDQYYASDIVVGTQGRFKLDGIDHDVAVSKIYPEVINGAFIVDAEFIGGVPDSIRRGQTLTVELVWGAAKQALMVRKGGFYQHTGGRWAYLIEADGESARKVNIRLGRQNPQSVEVLEGLREGERIITSGYDVFNDMEILEFSESVN